MMPPLLKRLDRYILRHFFTALGIITLSCEIIFVLINVVEKLSHFIDNNVPMVDILNYYLLYSGWVIKNFFPIFVLLATLYSVTVLARRREILAMKASGLSLYRIAFPILAVGLLLSASHYYYNEHVYPPISKKFQEVKAFTVERKSKRSFRNVTKIHRQIRPGYFYTIASFDVDRQIGSNVRVYETRENRLRRIVTADRLIWEDFRWHAQDGVLRAFDDTLGEHFSTFESLMLPDIQEKPEDFARRVGKPEDMGEDELKRYIDLMKRTGGPYHRESIDLGIKRAYPLSSFIVILICIPYAANTRRGGVAVSFAMGALIALIYFVMFRILQSAGYNDRIPYVAAVWGINAAFFIVGVLSMLSARK